MSTIASDPARTLRIREYFPGLYTPQIFFDNAGGAQVLSDVISSVQGYLLTHNVQHGGTYALSKQCEELYAKGYNAAASYINAERSEIVFGSSVTQLFRNLSQALAPQLQPGDEIILSALDHEANIASWVQMAEMRNATIKWWTSTNRENPTLEASDLSKLMSEKTKFVACTHTSNLLGTITNIKEIAKVVHEVPGAMLCVDGVAYTPHRPLDVKELGVDFYAFSWYKVYGPHISLLYASATTHPNLTSLSHYFKLKHTSPQSPPTLETMLGLAGCNYELISSIPHITKYLSKHGFWHWAIGHEEILQRILLDFLNSKPDLITVYGPRSSSSDVRVPVISFAVKGWGSRELVETIQGRSMYGFKWGHNYSYRLVEGVFGFGEAGVEDGVVRVSLVHYNTVEEVEGFVKLLDEVMEERSGKA